MSGSDRGSLSTIIGGTVFLGLSLLGGWNEFTHGGSPFGPWLIFAAFGLAIAGSGLWKRLLSPESRARRLGVGPLAIGRPVAPALAYRAPPGAHSLSAREAYALALPTLPLRRIPEIAGRTLARALRVEDRGAGWFLLFFSFFWNAMTFAGVAAGLASDKLGILLFMVPFVLAGVVVTVLALHKLLGQRKVASVELSAEPAFAGDEVELFVSQPGPAAINRFKATLRCMERATYKVGTATRTETHTVFEEPIFEEGPFTVARSLPWERRATMRLPSRPHSFKSDNNEIVWTVRFEADIDRWPDYDESFEVRVLPRVAAEGT